MSKNAKEIATYCAEHGIDATAKHYGLQRSTVEREIRRANEDPIKKRNKVTVESTPKGLTITDTGFKSNETNTEKLLNEFLLTRKVDLDKWEVDRHILSSWDVTMKDEDGEGKTFTNHSIKVFLKPKAKRDVIEGIKSLIKNIPTYKIKTFPKVKNTGMALEMAVLDAHIGKMAWHVETGRGDYDLDIALEEYEKAVDTLLGWGAYFTPEKIFFIVGQDLFHIDNIEGKTARGKHDLDVDGRLPKIFEQTFELITKCIYRCRAVAPVEIVWIPGNHDYSSSMYLCYILKEHFKKDKAVIVDIGQDKGMTTRKARLWGNLLVGWTHQINGRQNAWSNELAQAFPRMWGESVFREWHHGHKHRKGEVKTSPTITQGGVLCRQLTALSPIDKWHYENLFTDAVPGGESFIWSKDVGVISNFTAWSKNKIK